MNKINSKIPKWAQQRIADLERQRDAAINKLNQWQDSQTESAICNPDYVCTGEGVGPTIKKQYIQATRLEIEWYGVKLHVLLRESDKCIDLQYGAGKTQEAVCLTPRSYQQFWLTSKENAR